MEIITDKRKLLSRVLKASEGKTGLPGHAIITRLLEGIRGEEKRG
jgi:hypothetical protein